MTCPSGKDSYPSFRMATESARRTQHRNRATGKTTHRMEAYHCPLCTNVHVTGHNGRALN